MKGSLEDSPIVIVLSRWLPGLLVPLPVAFTAAGIWVIAYDPRLFVGYFLTGAAGFFGAFLVWRILSPPRLEISPQGLAFFTGRTTLQYDWKDFSDFRAYWPGRGFFKYVGYGYASDSPKRSTISSNAFVIATLVRDGIDGSFGGPWEMPAQKLADLLNQARLKWG